MYLASVQEDFEARSETLGVCCNIRKWKACCVGISFRVDVDVVEPQPLSLLRTISQDAELNEEEEDLGAINEFGL